MTLKDSYRIVIAAEIRAQKMYQALAKSFAKPETSNVFKELVVLEKLHEEKVWSAFAREFPGQAIELQEEPVKEMQGINLNDPQEVLEFAISKEEEAVELYKNMTDITSSEIIERHRPGSLKLRNNYCNLQMKRKVIRQFCYPKFNACRVPYSGLILPN